MLILPTRLGEDPFFKRSGLACQGDLVKGKFARLNSQLPDFIFDKVLLSMDGSIGGAVFACQGILCIEKQGLAMRLEK
jgi:hypothetical protein